MLKKTFAVFFIFTTMQSHASSSGEEVPLDQIAVINGDALRTQQQVQEIIILKYRQTQLYACIEYKNDQERIFKIYKAKQRFPAFYRAITRK
jgi:hypothetical protein